MIVEDQLDRGVGRIGGECCAPWHSRERADQNGRPTASDVRCPAWCLIRSAAATTRGNRPGHGPSGNTRSVRCDQRSHSAAQEILIKTAQPVAHEGHGTDTAVSISSCPEGASFSQHSLRKSVAYYSGPPIQ
jgi:hypothetical protein